MTGNELSRVRSLNRAQVQIRPVLTIPAPIHRQEPSRILLNDEQKQSLLDSLKFEQIDARQMTIKTAHAKTCRWLLKSEQYLYWLDTTKVGEHHGFLWIKGNAGTGKSTLMKFALVNARKTMKDHTVLSFFFNARGEEIEKSTIGTYRSLLLQLLERLPALQSVFNSLGLSTSSFNADYQWNVESLKTLLEQAIRLLGDSSVVCLIDALDECEEEQVRDMIQFFEHIGELAVSNGIRFQVCFSSRHYPHITIRNGLELVLEGQEGHSQDITNYVETELKIGKSKVAQQIRVELQEKASGIFMWVVLVVGILNKESDRGQVHALRRKLRETPSDLHELFLDILTRDTHNKYGLILCIQWILFAKQPLSPEQLYHAILSGVNLEAVTEWDPQEITKDVIERLILDSSKGLAEVTASKEPKAQFIHESVRDFLLKENGLSKIWPEYGNNFQGQSHNQLKQCCLDYISVDVATPLKIPDKLPKASSQPAASLRKSAAQKFPFLEYAVRNVLYHADIAESGGISQVDLLDSFPLPLWVKLDNLFEKREVRRHTERVSLLYLLAELNAANLIRAHPSVSSCLDVENERYGCAFFAANAIGNQEVMQACIEGLKASQSVTDHGRRWPEEYSREERLEGSLGRDFKYSKKVGMLIYAVETGSVAVSSYLIGLRTLDLDSKDTKGRTPLYVAAEKSSSVLTRLLLDKGADVNAQGGHFGNALQAASARGHEAVVKLLLDKGAEVNAQGGHFGNALQAASYGGDEAVVKMLLDKGADVKARGGEYGNALQAASYKGHEAVVKLLLDQDADVNAQGGYFGNALQAASSGGRTQVVELLLDNGADSNCQGGQYGNALVVAAADDGCTPIHAAAKNGHADVVILLLDRGADCTVAANSGLTPLHSAAENGHVKVVRILLEKGANWTLRDEGGDTPLILASSQGRVEVVKMLLEEMHSSEVDLRNTNDMTALMLASRNGHVDVARLLLATGSVSVQTKNAEGFSSLSLANKNGHLAVVSLLHEYVASHSLARSNADSGYSSIPAQSADDFAVGIVDADDAKTTYSDFSIPETTKGDYIDEIVGDIAAKVRFDRSNGQLLERIYKVLPELLKGFALSVGRRPQDGKHGNIMVFIYQNRECV
jgi:ankyrin repeat protein